MRRTIWAALILCVYAPASAADDSVLQIIVSPDPVSGLDDVFYLAAGVELTRAGLTSRRVRTSVVGRSGATDMRLVGAAARSADAAFVLLLEYVRDDSGLSYRLALYATPSETPIATRCATSPIDIDLDARFAAAVRELIAEAGVGGRRTEQTAIEGVDLALGASGTPVLERVAGPELSVVTSGLFVAGGGTDWFRYGAAASLSGGYVPVGTRFGVLLGVRSAVIRLFREEGVEGGDLSVVTGGADVLVGTVYRAPARIGVRASAGAAALVVVRRTDTLAKVVPYAEAGLAARVPLGKMLAVGAEFNWLVVFEPGVPLMWLSPSVTVTMEL